MFDFDIVFSVRYDSVGNMIIIPSTNPEGAGSDEVHKAVKLLLKTIDLDEEK